MDRHPLIVTRIGLTGGIGSGKSTVAQLLASLGAHVVDTDALAHALTAAGGAALPAIVAAFGPEALAANGAMDRAWMRERAFSSPSERQRLEAILHPLIGLHTEAAAARATAGQPVVFDVPLLAESAHWRRRVERVLVIDCSAETQADRVRARSDWTDEAITRVLAQQASRARRRAIADAVIHNDGLSRAALADEVRQLWRGWGGTAG